tara:strand:+ start:263 stop:1255 length:993 start_codon:yes stop_codon:yes gene_type:complete
MIIKYFEIKKIKVKKNSIILLYGKNEGLKKQTKSTLLENKVISSNYEEAEILSKPNEFFETISSKSFFEEEKIIFISRVTDKICEIISEIVEKEFEDLMIILDSDSLEKKSKIRSLFEKSKKHFCIPCYPDTDETLTKLAFQILKKNNISISSSNLNLVVNRCNGDRKLLFIELEKITHFVKNGKKINYENISKLTNLVENHSFIELIDNCLAKNKNKTVNILIENNFSSEDSIIITRIFLSKLKKILSLCTEFQKNKNLDLTISTAKPPIFWKEKEITKKQIINWTPQKVKEALYQLSDIELSIKKNYNNSINQITDFLLDLVSKKTNN